MANTEKHRPRRSHSDLEMSQLETRLGLWTATRCLAYHARGIVLVFFRYVRVHTHTYISPSTWMEREKKREREGGKFCSQAMARLHFSLCLLPGTRGSRLFVAVLLKFPAAN